MPTKVRYIIPHGRRVWLRVYWGDGCDGNYHNAMLHLHDTAEPDEQPRHEVSEFPLERWPTACEDCGQVVPAMPEGKTPMDYACGRRRETGEPNYQVFYKTLYATPNRAWIGMPTVGDAYYADWYGCAERGGNCVAGWTNCDGHHLVVHVPNPGGHVRPGHPDEGYWWDTRNRASNCTMKEDTLHRCWVVHGRPEDGNLHVDKAGLSCNAGAGSLDTGRWHGMLQNGWLTP